MSYTTQRSKIEEDFPGLSYKAIERENHLYETKLSQRMLHDKDLSLLKADYRRKSAEILQSVTDSIVCLEFFTHMETSPFPLKGCEF